MPAPAVSEALATLLEIREEERGMTTAMIEATPAGARLHGLEFRVKSPSSLARKITTRAMTRRQTPAQASASIADLVRYTAVSAEHDDLVPTARMMVDALAARGFAVQEAEHSYVEDSPYKGLHLLVSLTRPEQSGAGEGRSGMVVELQIHSERSQSVKDAIHVDYELERDPGADWSLRALARRRMVDASSLIPAPAGLDDLSDLGGVAVEVKRYPDPYTHELEEVR